MLQASKPNGPPSVPPGVTAPVMGPPREDSRGPPPAPRSYPSHSAPVSSNPASMTNLYSPLAKNAPIPRNFYMRTGDIKFVVSRILHPLETMDPYFDDYYYLQYILHKTKQSHLNAMYNGLPPPAPIYSHIPTPLWKDTKERVLKELQESKVKLANKTNQFDDEGEENTTDKIIEEKPLGLIVKSDIFKPREMISMSALKSAPAGAGASDGDEDDYGDSVTMTTTAAKVPFQSKLWGVRAAVQRGFEALFTVQVSAHTHCLT